LRPLRSYIIATFNVGVLRILSKLILIEKARNNLDKIQE
jgi:hypothetical protein